MKVGMSRKGRDLTSNCDSVSVTTEVILLTEYPQKHEKGVSEVFRKLFTPYKIGSMEVSNRLVVPAMVTNFCTEDGYATERYIAYHEAKAKGGWGLIITEDHNVEKNAKGYRFIPGLWSDDHIESHRQLTDRIHRYETKIVAQIYHPGRQSTYVSNGGVQPVAPSAIPCPWCRDLPREMTVEEIKKVVSQFGDAALRAKKAGFDGVEIHGAHGYLIAQFMSPYTNKRTDEYGGCLQKRMRLVKEIIEDIRSKVGEDFPVIFRISADEVMPGGRDMAETGVIVRLLESWGVDALHISTGVYGNDGIVSNYTKPHAWAVKYAEEVKKLVNIPVITVNRINDPLMADLIIDTGKADFVAMGRGSLADPDLPNKAKSGDLESIRYCIGCMQGCTRSTYANIPISCSVNPTLGLEYTTHLDKAATVKKVFVAGGGPAGMEAARAAALKGHDVHLYEKNDYLGGQFKAAAYPPYKGELASFTAWQIAELKKAKNVTIHLGTELTPEIVKSEKPHVVIVATGATPIIPSIPGVNRPNVLLAQDVLLGKVATGDNCFVAGGGSVGLETAAHLAIQLKRVAIAEMLPELAQGEDRDIVQAYLRILDEYGVVRFTDTRVVEIAETGVLLEKNGVTTLYPCDTVILAFGSTKNDSLAAALEGLTEKVVTVGDAVKVGHLLEAVRQGFWAGLEA